MAKTTGIKGLYLRNGWFYFQPPTPKGGGAKRPTAVALGTTDLVTAIQTMEERKSELSEWQAARRETLDDVLPRYYKDKSHDAVFTRRQREMILSGFSEVLGNPRVDTITTQMIEDWREHVAKHGSRKVVKDPHRMNKNGKPQKHRAYGTRSPATVKTYTIVVKAFFNWAVEEKMIATSPLRKMKRQTVVSRTKVQEFLTEEEREKLLAADTPDYMRFILYFGFFAGLRDGEMLAMRPRWIWISPDGSYGTLTVQNEPIVFTDGSKGEWRPKVRELRTIPLHPRLMMFLRDYGMDPAKDEPWARWRDEARNHRHRPPPWMLKPEKELWPADHLKSKRFDASKGMTALAERCGVRKLNYHILRHSFATHLVMKGVSLADVAGLLGDSLQVTQDHYAGYSPNKVNHLSVL